MFVACSILAWLTLEFAEAVSNVLAPTLNIEPFVAHNLEPLSGRLVSTLWRGWASMATGCYRRTPAPKSAVEQDSFP